MTSRRQSRAFIVAMALSVASGAAEAQSGNGRPLATASVDFDGDGAAEIVQLWPGRVDVQSAAGASLAMIPLSGSKPVGSGTIQQTAAGAGTVALVVAGREAIALAWQRGSVRAVARNEIGPTDPSGNTVLHMEAGRRGLLRYYQHAGVRRCDGKTAFLAAERFDPRAGRFRPVAQPVRLAASSATLTATPTAPAGVAAHASGQVFAARAASSQYGVPVDQLAAPLELTDGDPATAWIEGKSSDGKGEFITLRAETDNAEVRLIRIVPGHGGSKSSWRGHNRLKEIGLIIDGATYRVRFETDPAKLAAGTPFWISLPATPRGSCLSLVLVDVYGKPGAGHTAIAEIDVLTDIDIDPSAAARRLIADIMSGGTAGERAASVLARLGSIAETELLAALTGKRSRSERDRLRRALALVPAGAEQLARGLAEPRPSASDIEAFQAALVAMGAAAVAPLAAVIRDRSVPGDGRARVVAALGRIADASATAELIALAGGGTRAIRRQIAFALGSRPGAVTDILAAARAANTVAARADLWRAGGLAARHLPAAEAASIERELIDQLGKADQYELRYRLIEAIAAIATAPGIEALAEHMRTTDRPASRSPLADARAEALRRVTVTAVTDLDRPQATALLKSALSDTDPGVREQAAEALAARPQRAPAADDALAKVLAADSWPTVRSSAALALGRTCGERVGAAQALRQAVSADADIDVRRAALAALASCRAEGTIELFLSVARADDQSIEVRSQAIRLLGTLDDAGAVTPLIEILRSARQRAFSDAEAVTLAQSAAYALGTMADPRASEALRAAVADSAVFPEIQAAAATALGRLCAARATERAPAIAVLRQASASGQAASVAAIRSALRQCQSR